jgi:sulfoxide reductase heme-binding subunit YedZ
VKRLRFFRWTRVVDPPEPASGYAAAVIAASGLGTVAVIAIAALFGLSPSPLTWYLVRASGMTLYLLLWLSVVCGLGLTTKLLDRSLGGRAMVFSLHAFATRLAYGFLALHLVTLAADESVRFGPRELVVPFATSWREPWTGFGVIAAYLLVLLGASFGVRRLTGYRTWRALHWLAFPLYALALAHGLGAGSDSGAGWARGLYALTAGAVVVLTLYRVLRGPRTAALPAPPEQPRLDRLLTAPRHPVAGD